MPSVTETAKEATYTVVGMPVVLFDQINERFAPQRRQLNERIAQQRHVFDEQLKLAREHGQSARERVQPVANRTLDAADATFRRLSDLTPSPMDGYVQDSLARVRQLVGADVDTESVETEINDDSVASEEAATEEAAATKAKK